MNTIEMQSITAIAHLRAAILYFMDLSEQCGYSVQAQIQLFKSIKPLFANKIVFVVINKIDVRRPEDLDPESQEQLQSILKSGEVELLQLSCNTQEGVQEVKNAACERLIAERVSQKLKGRHDDQWCHWRQTCRCHDSNTRGAASGWHCAPCPYPGRSH